jgi:hypothetical protein
MLAHGMLDDSVFERVKGDHGKSSTHCQTLRQGLHRLLYMLEFPIHSDAQSLKRSSRTVDPTVDSPWHQAMDQIGKLFRSLDRLRLARFDNRPRDPPRKSLLAELIDGVCDFLLGPDSQEIRCADPRARIEP